MWDVSSRLGLFLSLVSGLVSDSSEPWVHISSRGGIGRATHRQSCQSWPHCLIVASSALSSPLCMYLCSTSACRYTTALPGKLLARVTRCPGCIMFHRNAQTGRRDRAIPRAWGILLAERNSFCSDVLRTLDL